VIATATCNNESVAGNLSAKSSYRRCDLVNFSEHYDGRETSFVAGGNDWMEHKKPHCGSRSWYIDMGFLDEHDVRLVLLKGKTA
jgi:hypothetical protein